MVCVEQKASRSSIGLFPVGQEPYVPLPDQSQNLAGLLVESIEEALTDLLGKRARDAVYDYLERNCFVARTELPGRLEVLVNLLEETFGKGSKTICKVIAKKLYSKLDWEFAEVQGYGLLEYVETARARIAREILNHTKRI